MFRIWYAKNTQRFKDYIIENTKLNEFEIESKILYQSDNTDPKNFHSIPDHLKKILYLDCPDIIVEKNFEPILVIEDSREAGTGHNVFQRFARLAAAAENHVPCFYIFPEAKIITRKGDEGKWDKLNPLIFKTLNELMEIYNIPNFIFYYPSDYKEFENNIKDSPNFDFGGLRYSSKNVFFGCPDEKDIEMKKMFELINLVIDSSIKNETKDKLLKKISMRQHKSWMQEEYLRKNPNNSVKSPLTSIITIPTKYLINYLSSYEDRNYKIGELIRSREETVIYQTDAKFRGDPYPGALAAIDYLECREGETYEERIKNLVHCWGKVEINEEEETISINSKEGTSINDFINKVKLGENRNLTTKNYTDLKNSEIPRYYMQVRYGTIFTKNKLIRIYSYFSDAILFSDGSLWRDG